MCPDIFVPAAGRNSMTTIRRLSRACAPPAAGGRKPERRDAMTLKEMGGEYRAQALVLQARIRELREACRQAETEGEKEKLR